MTTTTQTANPYQTLDTWFTNLGFKLIPMGKFMPSRKWTGTWKNRQTTVICSPRTRTRYQGEDISRQQYIGHELTIEMETSVFTRLTFTPDRAIPLQGLERFLLSRMRMTKLENTDAQFQGIKIAAFEPDWAYQYIKDPKVSQCVVSNILDDQDPTKTCGLRPGAANYRVRRSLNDIKTTRLEELLEALSQLCEVAESQPPPVKKAKLTRFEVMATENPAKLGMILIGAIMAIVLLITFAFIALVITGLFTAKTGVVLMILAYIFWKIKTRKKRRLST